MLQLAQRLCLDLTDALTGDVEFLADFLQRARTAIQQAEAQAEHLFLPFGQPLQHGVDLILQQLVVGIFIRRERLFILDEIAQVRVILFADRRFQRYWLQCDLLDLTHLLRPRSWTS